MALLLRCHFYCFIKILSYKILLFVLKKEHIYGIL